MKEFINSLWWTVIAYGLIVVGGLVAVFHLIGNPAVMITIICFVITGLILLGIRFLINKKE